MQYRSKIDWWFYLIMTLFTFSMICEWVLFFYNRNGVFFIMGILLTCINCLFIIPLMIDTRYTFENEFLHIKSWICCNKKIKYLNILSITESRNPVSSPALSMDRIEIRFSVDKSTDTIMISPVNKTEFLEKLRNYSK